MILNSKNFNNYINKNFAFEYKPTVAVAVSGGPDSMALLFLVNKWIELKNGKIIALIVNHGVRPNSKSEANQIKAWGLFGVISFKSLIY